MKTHFFGKFPFAFCVLIVLLSSFAEFAGAEPLTGHPRLWVRGDDLSRLRSWATSANPIYKNGLAVVASQAKADMDSGLVPDEDNGGTSWTQYPTEMYAELFAFMSLIGPNQTIRDDYAQRAVQLLMYVIDRAALGPAEDQPFRYPAFSTSDRSRWWGEGFALTVDWIYPYLNPDQKKAIRKVFLRWTRENMVAETTSYNHPEPQGVVNDPVLTQNRLRVRWASNNYYEAHMRNIGLMSMALDAADDPDEKLRAYLKYATGSWLYVIDDLLRTDARGGLAAEGFEYSPQSTGYVAQFLWALQSAGQDDPSLWGPQVVLTGNPFWKAFTPAYLHSLSPATTIPGDGLEYLGPVYLPAWFGDGQNYWAGDTIDVFGALGLQAYARGDDAQLNAARWIQKHLPPGGPKALLERAQDSNSFRAAILYFMLFDPDAAAAANPRTAYPLHHYAAGIGHILVRTGWGSGASWFTYGLGWNRIDHQHGDGNSFELYRKGEWLTKERTGYGWNVACSDYHNTLALENAMPDRPPDDWRYLTWKCGGQWSLLNNGDGKVKAISIKPAFVYVLGDATRLYNTDYEGLNDITHASRSIVWFKPDHVIVYDRAATSVADRFKRFWLQLPSNPTIAGNRATVTTAKGQKLFITTLQPEGAGITANSAKPGGDANDETANNEPMHYRLRVTLASNPKQIRFLHVLQGADSGAGYNPPLLIESSAGNAYTGAAGNHAAVLFPKRLGVTFTGMSYTAPNSTATHIITGLKPEEGYDVGFEAVGTGWRVTVAPGTAYHADKGGVLLITK
jgi:hypothetical protein